MKRRLALIPFLAITLVMVFSSLLGAIIPGASPAAHADTPTSSLGLTGDYILVKLSGNGSTAASSYSLTAKSANGNSISMQYQNKLGGFLGKIADGGNGPGCVGNSTFEAVFNVSVSASLNGKSASSTQSYNLCGKTEGDTYDATLNVSPTPQQAPKTGCFAANNLTYKGSDSTTYYTIGDSATANLKGGPDDENRTLSVSGGSIAQVCGIPVGTYTFIVNYVPNASDDVADAGKNQNITATEKITDGSTTTYAGHVSTASAGGGGGGGGTTPPTLTCDTEITDPLTWILCPIIDLLTSAVGAIDGWITSELTTNANPIFCNGTGCNSPKNQETSSAYYTAWASFRNIALGLMILAGLIMLVAHALGVEILDAYTIRKVLPRIMIAAIGITLSWPLMQFMVNFSNHLGLGVRNLIYAPFSDITKSAGIDLTFGSSVGGGLGNFFFGSIGFVAAAGAGVIALPIIISFLGTAALAVFVAFVVLILRQIAIILLILIAPIAIVAYIFPNTERIYKLWWDSFSRALLMFPLIAAFIAAGRVFSAVTLSESPNILNDIIGFMAYFAPYFLIPATFKLAGGAIRQLGGFVNDRSRGGFDRLRQRRGRQTQQIGQNIRSGNALRNLGAAAPGSLRGRVNRGLQQSAHLGEMGVNPVNWRRRINEGVDTTNEGNAEEAVKEKAVSRLLGNDDVERALSETDGTEAQTDQWFRNNHPEWDGEQRRQAVWGLSAARRKVGDHVLRQTLTPAATASSTSFANNYVTDEEGNVRNLGGAGQMLASVADASEGNANTMAGMINKIKQTAPQAGRNDLDGSFATLMTHATNISRAATPEARAAAISAANDAVYANVIDTKGAGAVAGAKGQAIENLMPHMLQRVDDARGGLQTAVQNARNGTGTQEQVQIANRQLMQAFGTTAGFHDVLSQTSPESARLFADNLLQRQFTDVNTDGNDGRTVTLMQAIDGVRTNSDFQQVHKEYIDSADSLRGQRAAQEAAARAAMNPDQRGPQPGPGGL